MEHFKKITLLLLLVFLNCCTTNKKPLNKQDPLESLNRKLYKVHKTIDALYVNPMVKVYVNVVPDPLKKLVTNFFNNVGEIPTIINSLLQANFPQAINSTARLTLNTTLGVGGLFNVASYSNLNLNKADFGQTLYKWGYKRSVFVFLPIIGPTTVRDGLGFVGNTFISAPYYFRSKWRNRYNVGYIIQRKADLNEMQSFIDTVPVDEYIFIRDSYLQNRKYTLGDLDVQDQLDEPVD